MRNAVARWSSVSLVAVSRLGSLSAPTGAVPRPATGGWARQGLPIDIMDMWVPCIRSRDLLHQDIAARAVSGMVSRRYWI
ncbi:hypothetical protein QBC41DRAFT_320071 [Cercophora samala]|uniref:Secreted protein n=1 Tax=Cercophora samala TaxID=330535 RepID=A0AA39ZE56_9PEZI|nr:hypothetical protein QBC41DRAFT_320071 [Cercophora samala]